MIWQRFSIKIILIKSDTRPLNRTIKLLLDTFGESIHFFRDATRGGVASVLDEVATDAKTVISIVQKDIPVNEACEMLGLDPLYVANEGVFLAIVGEAIENSFVKVLFEQEDSKLASIIGHVTADHPQQVILKSSIGGRRVVNRLTG